MGKPSAHTQALATYNSKCAVLIRSCVLKAQIKFDLGSLGEEQTNRSRQCLLRTAMAIRPQIEATQGELTLSNPEVPPCPLGQARGEPAREYMVRSNIWAWTFKVSLQPCPPAQARGLLEL